MAMLLQFGGSLVAILALYWIARRLGLGGDARIRSEDDARDLAEEAHCGFEPHEIALDREGRGALLRDDKGRVMVLRHIGACNPGCPTVMMGDFNQWGLKSGAMREFGETWKVLDTGRSFPSRQPLACLDRVVTSHEWSCAGHHVHHSATAAQASDHLPVVAHLKLHKK